MLLEESSRSSHPSLCRDTKAHVRLDDETKIPCVEKDIEQVDWKYTIIFVVICCSSMQSEVMFGQPQTP
jgi:hypothetical protein